MICILENEALRLWISTLGAEMIRVQSVHTGRDLSWPGDPEIWPRRAPILWPYVGCLKGGTYTLDGETFSGVLHGFARDREFYVENHGADFVELTQPWSEETLALFPRQYYLHIRFQLDGHQVIQTVTVENADERPMYFGFGYHPGFVMPFDQNHKTEDYELRFDCPQSPELVEVKDGLVTGRITPFMDHSAVIPLSNTMFDGGSLCLQGLTAKTVSLVEKDSGRNITMDIDGFPYFLLWSMPGNPELHYLCMEPWHNLQDRIDASGDWNEKPCAARLEPMESWESQLKVTFNNCE